MLSKAVKQVRRKEGKVTVKSHTTRLPKQQEDKQGIRGERGDGSFTLLGKTAIRRGERGWMLTMMSQTVTRQGRLSHDYISKNNPWHLVRPLRLAHLAHITSTANQDATT